MAAESRWSPRIWSTSHLYNYLKRIVSSSVSPSIATSIRDTLPEDMETWRLSFYEETYPQLWSKLGPFFRREGYTLWNHSEWNALLQGIKTRPVANNYYFDSLTQKTQPVLQWIPHSGLQHAIRGDDMKDYVVRVMSMSGSDENNLRIWRRLSSTYPDILLSNNHILPIVREIFFEDITFAIFPKLHGDLMSAILPELLPETKSVEDIVYLLMQALEAIVYIHEQNIAHRDLFLENFLVEWFPESLVKRSCTRPRVYLIDFETAVEFSKDSTPSEQLSTELPFPDDKYHRSRAPELSRDPLTYCPFRLDMWQFGHDLIEMFTSTGLPEIDNLWPTLVNDVPEERPTAREALQTLGNFVKQTTPEVLHVPWTFVPFKITEVWHKSDSNVLAVRVLCLELAESWKQKTLQ